MQNQMGRILAVAAGLICANAYADEAIFGYIYTTDSLPKGTWEYEQIHTVRSGKARGDYFAWDWRNEIEYGVSDRFSASLYLNSSYVSTKNVYDPEDVSTDLKNQAAFDVNGTSLELKYRLLSPYTDPIGLSLYLEPEIAIRDHMTGENTIERALEFRLILQKNFFDDLLILASNFMLEPEWERKENERPKELWFEGTFGASYRFRENWFAGVEFRNHREYPNMDMFGMQEHSAYFLGPSIHYGSQKWWATATILPQIMGSPQVLGRDHDGNLIQDSTLHLGQHEKFEARLKFGINL